MPDEDSKPFDWKIWLSKQGFNGVLLVALLWFIRSDVLRPMMMNLDKQTEINQVNSVLLKEIRDDQRRGTWRVTEPPKPSELPKGVEPAKE